MKFLALTGILLVAVSSTSSEETLEDLRQHGKRGVAGQDQGNEGAHNAGAGQRVNYVIRHGNGGQSYGDKIGATRQEYFIGSGQGSTGSQGSQKIITLTKPVPVPVPQPIPFQFVRNIPIPVPHNLPYQLEKPYPIQINKQYPIPLDRPLQYQIEKRIPYPVQVNVPVPQQAQYQVPRLVAIPIPQHFHQVPAQQQIPAYNQVPLYIQGGGNQVTGKPFFFNNGGGIQGNRRFVLIGYGVGSQGGLGGGYIGGQGGLGQLNGYNGLQRISLDASQVSKFVPQQDLSNESRASAKEGGGYGVRQS